MGKYILIFISLWQFVFAQADKITPSAVPVTLRVAAACLVNINIQNETKAPIKREFNSPEYGNTEGKAKGTAFVFYDKTSQNHYLITAAHVISSRFKPKIFKGNDTINLQIDKWVWDSQKDLAIARITSTIIPQNIKPIEFSDLKALKKGDTIYVPLDNGNFERGVVQDTDASSNDNIAAYHLLQCSNPVEYGQSGTPVLNKEGKIAGIVLRKKTENGTNASFAMDRETFAKLFAQLQREGKARRFYTGMVFELNGEGKPIIKNYIPNSPADKKDTNHQYTKRVLTKINEKEVKNLGDIHKIMEDLPDNNMLLTYEFKNAEPFSIIAENSSDAAQEAIADYFFEKYIPQPAKAADIMEVYVEDKASTKYQYLIGAKSELGAIIRTFSWNTQLVFWDKVDHNYTHKDKEKEGDIKYVLIF